MFQQVISGFIAKLCSCYLALSVRIIEISVVSQRSHLNPAKKLVNSAFVFQLCVSHCISSTDVATLEAGRKVKGGFWAGFLRKGSSRGGIVSARVCVTSLATCVFLRSSSTRPAARVGAMGKLLSESFVWGGRWRAEGTCSWAQWAKGRGTSSYLTSTRELVWWASTGITAAAAKGRAFLLVFVNTTVYRPLSFRWCFFGLLKYCK